VQLQSFSYTPEATQSEWRGYQLQSFIGNGIWLKDLVLLVDEDSLNWQSLRDERAAEQL